MLKNKKILLVESNLVNRLLISSLLSEAGAYVQIIASEEQLEGYQLAEEIDIALIDLHFAGANGLSILKKMVAKKGENFPLFGMTNSIVETRRIQPNLPKLCQLIEKPFSIETFRGALLEQSKNDLEVDVNDPSALYSISKIEGMSRGNDDFVKRMIEIFVDDIPKSLDKITQALSEENYAIIKAAVHRIKPSLKMMSVNSIEQDVEKLETYCAESLSLDEVPALVARIEEVLLSVVTQLKSR